MGTAVVRASTVVANRHRYPAQYKEGISCPPIYATKSESLLPVASLLCYLDHLKGLVTCEVHRVARIHLTGCGCPLHEVINGDIRILNYKLTDGPDRKLLSGTAASTTKWRLALTCFGCLLFAIATTCTLAR